MTSRPGDGRLARWRASVRVCCLLAVAALLATGCASSFSGGSVPIGRAATLRGFVVNGSNVNTAIGGANVTLQVQQPGRAAVTRDVVKSAPDGSFEFPSVDVGDTVSTVKVTVAPPSPSYQAVTYAFLLYAGHSDELVAALAPAGFDVSTGVAATVSPQNLTVQVSTPVKFDTSVRDANGNRLPISASLLLDSLVATITPAGTLTGTAVGDATLYVLWYGSVHSSAATITVTPAGGAGSGSPPPPPPPTSG